MAVVTTHDGQQFELRPCPSWCTGQHFEPGAFIHAEDGFHHTSRPIRIETATVTHLSSPKPASVEVSLQAWVARLDAEPEPTEIELKLADSEGESVDLTPAMARLVAEALNQITEQADRAGG